MDFTELHTFLLRHLTQEVMPFWIRHSIDWQNGGMWTCLADDGSILNRDKYIWSNARGLWTFSALVNRVADTYPDQVGAKVKDIWQRAADNQYSFLKHCGRDEKGYWVFVVDEAGEQVVVGEDSIVVDAFAIYGLVEYFRMTGDDEALDIAHQTANTCLERLARPGTYKTAPYPTPPGMRPQREAMQFSLMFCELGHELGDETLLDAGLQYGQDVLDHFYRTDRQVLLEYLGLDNSVWDTPAGRAMVPGHAIESLWFQIHNFTRIGDTDRARQAAGAMHACFEKGWDPEYGGLFLGIDVQGIEPPYWKNAEKKIWWPFTEAICGALLAYEQLGEDWCLEWYWNCHDWAFAHFPDKKHGEWTQKLDRRGNKIEDLIALPVKDPYHLPRGLIVAIETLERLTMSSRDSQPRVSAR
jgi:N-acylglucosamine 2-epimerase